GSMRPSLAAICTSPWAMALVAMSKTIGGPSARGAANAIGLVPNSGFCASCGTTHVMLLTTLSATSPSVANGWTSGDLEGHCGEYPRNLGRGPVAQEDLPQQLGQVSTDNRPACGAVVVGSHLKLR